jgi:sialate O-acetylesterase
MRNLFSFLFFFLCFATSSKAQSWNGKKAAIVLTYDDALHVHLDNAIPLLDSLQFKATFYISAAYHGSQERIADWRKAAGNGHELGNHTLFHPCIGGLPGREWVRPEKDLNTYTVQRMVDEIKMTNAFLEAVDGKTKRTFAYTCGDMTVNDTSFIELLKNDLVAARGVQNGMHPIKKVDLYNVDCYSVDGTSGKQMIQWVEKAMETGSLLVFLFHGVGGEHGIDVTLAAHRELLLYLKKHEKDLMITPLIDMAEYIIDQNRVKN